MNWKEQLNKKEKELNLTKGGQNGVCIETISGICSGSISRGGGITNLSNIRKKINNVTEKGGKGMITVEGALKDLEVIEQETNDTGARAIVKALKVVVKFLSTIRSNQLLTEEEKIKIRKAKEERVAKETKK